MSDEHCEFYVGDYGLEDGECGLPATSPYHFTDGSVLYFCPKHWEEWVKEEQEDLAEYGRDDSLGQSILDTLILNGVISK